MMISTKNKKDKRNIIESILSGMSNNSGLWIPEKIPLLSSDWINNLDKLTTRQICSHIMKLYFSPDISESVIDNIVEKAINFKIPLVKLDHNDYILELFHGPTMAFKDFGARVMALLFQHIIKMKNEDYRIIVSTSGDTGAAIADAFSHTDIPVYIFFPKDKISPFQEKQITSCGDNIKCFSLDQDFDKCQAIVKQVISSQQEEINSKRKIKFITANSINISRLIPQIFYYFISYSQLKKLYPNENLENKKIIYSVPSGNLGNATAGYMAKKMGLPIHKIMVATNLNNSFTKYLSNGVYNKQHTQYTISNAMDVGDPSNIKRIMSISDNNIEIVRKYFESISVDDNETLDTIRKIYYKYNYLMDPHTAVGYTATKALMLSEKDIKITLATASPSKFKEVIPVQFELPGKHQKILSLSSKYFECYLDNIIQKIIYSKSDVITLIGMPGSGKTTIANKLKETYSWNMIDTDGMIIEKYGKRLVEIVDELGDNFMDEETNTMLSLTHLPNKTVISPGGSVIYSEKAMEHLSSLGIIIFLDTTVEDINNRIDNFLERGIVMKPGETIRDLYKQRLPYYHKYRELAINNSLLNISDTTSLINNLFVFNKDS